MFTLDPPVKYISDTIFYLKSLSMMMIGAIFLLENVSSVTQINNKHIIVKSIHSPLRSESKNRNYQRSRRFVNRCQTPRHRPRA